MTNQHPFIQFLFRYGACPEGIKAAKKHRTPQAFWGSRRTFPAWRVWLLTACKVPGFFAPDSRKGISYHYNTVLEDAVQARRKFPKIPWKRGQQGQFLYRHQKRDARIYARKLKAGLDPLKNVSS